AVMVQGVDTVFQTDIFIPIIQKIEEISGKKYQEHQRSFHIIADHIRTATFIIGDQNGVVPSNIDQGYIVRRLIRRAVRELKRLGVNTASIATIAFTVIEQYAQSYPELTQYKVRIIDALQTEEQKFHQTLDHGLREFEKIYAKNSQSISGQDAFLLFSSFGFPLEMTKELAAEHGTTVDEQEFTKEFVQHQQLSRKGAEQKFTGGLADHSTASRQLHTATHMLHKALKMVLGEQVEQKGSNITPERLRFDFNFERKLTDEEKKRVEDIINAHIQSDVPISCQEMTVSEAKKIGAIGLFEDEYATKGNKIKVYTIGEGDHTFSREICGGPHAEHTGELGSFKITSEKSASAGIRRIKAVISPKKV
ncbi:MAG TPA: alanine--tRNA ligase-related protein, partial [Patescibacteria group bacterium]|nr:alanine--tRNA ligase-related protein [Patescibacteria group bacterium]